jgi:transcriptional regulator with XRE-family HTH domain
MTSQASGDLATTVAVNVRVGRMAAGLTQRELAEGVGVDQMVVSKWERARHRPSQENMIRLADLVGKPVAWFYTEHEVAA